MKIRPPLFKLLYQSDNSLLYSGGDVVPGLLRKGENPLSAGTVLLPFSSRNQELQ